MRHDDFSGLTPIAGELSGADACLYRLGVSSVELSHEEYERITYDYTLEASPVVAADYPHAAFVYVPGEGADSTEQAGRRRPDR
ncbi:hypothetical protein [Streptomyces sp. S.PB5]|uniref:hypothetical protein n=1 Tax=Streptomyces sp. S.PB5 TaxID=3020844 RepID=UPI0025B0EDFB|nr:hypothetical protein [Streptomyces sp. S.PB5]MDN3028017.1 hypothetical protein [Streptomyces sp. S.PB5]